MAAEVDFSRKNLIRRLQELTQFKHSGSVKEGEIEYLQESIKALEAEGIVNLLRWHNEGQNPRSNNNKKKKSAKELNRRVSDIENIKNFIKTKNEDLDECEERFRKYNIPKRYQNGHKQSLEGYLERLQEFMEITWRKEAKKNREKGYKNLFELMTFWIDVSNEDGSTAFSSLATSSGQTGTRISNFIIEYIFLVTSNASNEMVSLCLCELKTVLESLSLDENYNNSTVINTFVVMFRFFMESMKLAGPFWGNDLEVKKLFYLDEEMEDVVVHHIIMEVLRLEVSFCSPDFIPMVLDNDVLFSMSVHLDRNVFADKLERVQDKINEWKFDIEFDQEGEIDDDQICSEMKFLRQVLEAGVFELWIKYDPECSLVNLVLI